MAKSKTKQKYTWIYIIFILGVFYLCFFQMERTEIGDIDIVRVLGIDYKDNQFQITALFNKNGGADTATSGVQVIDGKGKNIYEAYENLKMKSKHDISIAHTTYYIVSDQTARSGLLKCLDFISRDQTVKLNAMVYVMMVENVNSFMKDSMDQDLFIHEDLAAIKEKQMDRLTKVDNTISSVMNDLTNPNTNLLLPYLVYENGNLFVNGYAVFKNDKMYAYLDNETSMAVDFCRHRLRTYPLYINHSIGLEVTDYDVTKRVDIINGQLKVTIAVDFGTNIKEANDVQDVYEDFSMSYLDKEQNDYVTKMIQRVVELAKTNRVDLIGVWNEVRNQQSMEWTTLEKNWEYHFMNIEYDYKVTSRIGKNYLLGT